MNVLYLRSQLVFSLFCVYNMNVLYLRFFYIFFIRMSRRGMVASIHVSLKTDTERLAQLGSFKSEVSHLKCSKILNGSCLPKRPRQTVKSQIRLLLKKSEVSGCKCSKISNTSCLPKRPRQTVQTQIRLLLKKQSDQDLPCLLF